MHFDVASRRELERLTTQPEKVNMPFLCFELCFPHFCPYFLGEKSKNSRGDASPPCSHSTAANLSSSS